jgi:hypothetical protein
MKNTRGRKNINTVFFVAVIVIFLIIKGISWFRDPGSDIQNKHFRNSANLILTKHAVCRMKCRQITLEEIKEIIAQGNINKAKSGIGSKGDSTFALEGVSHEKQHIRVVVAEENAALMVITCIDLNKDWPCNCD